MAQQPISSPDLPADFDHHIILFPTRSATDGPAEPAAHSTSLPATGPQGRVRTHAIRQVVVLEVSCRLSEVVGELDRAIQLALAEGPRGVVCDLSNVLEETDPDAVEVLATAGRHVRDWPGTPVAVACPDPRVREALRAHPLGDHLIVTPSLFSAVSDVLATPTLAVERKHVAAHPTAPPRVTGIRHAHPAGLAVGPGHPLREPGDQRARGQLVNQCRHRHRPVRSLEPWGPTPDSSRPWPRPAGPAVLRP